MKSIVLGVAASASLFALAASGRPAGTDSAAQSATAKGEGLFRQRCAVCHAVSGKGGKMGPDLTGVVGRKAGSLGFAYSPAMKNSKKVWNAAALDAYLAAPSKAVPGTRMVVAVANAEERKAIIGYLASVRK